MSRASVLAAGRRAAEAGMIDTCTITRVTGTTTDDDTDVVTDTVATIYSGPCRVQEVVPFAREATPSPDQHVLAAARVLQLPVTTSTDVRVGDLAVIDSSVNDPDLVGVVMVIRGQKAKTDATARRLDVEEITG